MCSHVAVTLCGRATSRSAEAARASVGSRRCTIEASSASSPSPAAASSSVTRSVCGPRDSGGSVCQPVRHSLHQPNRRDCKLCRAPSHHVRRAETHGRGYVVGMRPVADGKAQHGERQADTKARRVRRTAFLSRHHQAPPNCPDMQEPPGEGRRSARSCARKECLGRRMLTGAT